MHHYCLGRGLPFNRLRVPHNKISKISNISGKMRNLPCRRWKWKWNDEMLQLVQTIVLFLLSIGKKKMRANARNFPETRLRENVIMWLYQKIQILSWNLTFRCQVLAIALLTIDTIAWNISHNWWSHKVITSMRWMRLNISKSWASYSSASVGLL